ncbi:GH23063 [Drosophila grimshawi]|uniref:Gustatory receptor n=1 Tax=Drosophila grimshawi TaxID=7222 RepID=B4JWK7_DROGR|nr:GH23063 [Drosophila grimshawi]
MFDLVQCLLRICYYYSRLMGVLNFEIDLRTGRPRTTRGTSIYAAVLNVMIICSLPWLIHFFWSQSEVLHKFMLLALVAGRVICICVTLLTRWLQRHRLIRLVQIFQRLTKRRPQVIRLWRRGVIWKLLSMFCVYILEMLISMVIFWEGLNLKLTLSIFIFSGIQTLINMITYQYYFALLNVHGHYILLNREICGVLAEIRSLELDHRGGVFVIKCCALADRLEDIARAQFQLQKLVTHLTNIFGLQTIFMGINYYLAGIGMVYIAFSELTGTLCVHWSNWTMALFCFQFTCYFLDFHILIYVIYSLLDLHAEMMKLISQNTLFAPGLDVRLEAIFENFKLQLAWSPLKFSVLGLFNLDKTFCVCFASSIVTRSLVLYQKDLENAYLC